jgi:hypothetical protein
MLMLNLTASTPLHAWVWQVSTTAEPCFTWEQAIGAVISLRELHRVGDDASRLSKHVTSHLSVMVDKDIIPAENIQMLTTFDLHSRSEFGIPLGTYSSELDVCFDVHNSGGGGHTATITTTTTWGEEYSYTWRFYTATTTP